MYSFDSRIRYSEVDETGLLRLESLIDYFQDCSTFQIEDGGIGIRYMKETHCAWLVNYWQIGIMRYPALGDRVRITTLPYETRGFLGLRNFYMETADGERLAIANSVWSLMDLEKMAPVRVPEKMLEVFGLDRKLDMDYKSRKIAVPKHDGMARDTTVIVPAHLDSNHHVNNGQYVRFAMGIIPGNEIVTDFRIEYKKQAVLGDIVRTVDYGLELTADWQNKRLIALDSDDGSTFAVAEIVTRDRKQAEYSAWH